MKPRPKQILDKLLQVLTTMAMVWAVTLFVVILPRIIAGDDSIAIPRSLQAASASVAAVLTPCFVLNLSLRKIFAVGLLYGFVLYHAMNLAPKLLLTGEMDYSYLFRPSPPPFVEYALVSGFETLLFLCPAILLALFVRVSRGEGTSSIGQSDDK